MATTGTLHIVRIQQDKGGMGVYDATYTSDVAPEPDPNIRVRRFYGEQELTEFLKKRLHRDPDEVNRLVSDLQQNGRARITNLGLQPEVLRDLDLAA